MTRNQRKVFRWLIIGCVLISAMVVVGGITRLTQSGLSMVEWKPIMGTLPPLSEEAWQNQFEKYQQSPEFIELNYDFSLDQFKSIFWWEYIHRLLARIIGIVFIIPFVYFIIRKMLSRDLLIKLLILLLLGALQGVIGWIMVMSGLVDNPHVSHYRLAIHLIAALILLCYTLWLALDLRDGKSNLLKCTNREQKGPGRLLKFFLALVVLQIIYGAFVAGLKAGLTYNTWPKMGSVWIADAIPYGFKRLGLVGLFENPAIVQFIHRSLGILCVLLGSWLWLKSRKCEYPKIKGRVNLIGFVLIAQFLLGVFTLVYQVPVSLGVMHQFGAIVLIVACISAIHAMGSTIHQPHLE